MNVGQVGSATTVEWNISGGYFGTSGARSQTYGQPALIFTNVPQNNGWGEAVTRFSSDTVVTGAGTFSTANAGLAQDFVFAGNMQAYTGNVSMANTGDASTTLGLPTSNIVQYGGETVGGTIALGTVTSDGTGNWINNVAGTGTITGNNIIFNYGTDSAYNYVAVTNAITQRDGVYFLGDANVVASGVISDAGLLQKSGSGTLTLSGANTYSGGTQVTAGMLVLGNTAALGTGVATVSSGATLDVAGFGAANAITIAGTGNGGNPALWNSGTGGTIGLGGVTLSANASVGNATTDASKLLGLGNLNLTGGTLTIATGAVSVDIRSIGSGDIIIANGGTLYSQNGGSLTGTTGTITINSGGRMETRDTDNTAMTSVQDIVLDGGTLSRSVILNNNGGGAGTTLRNNISVNATNGGTITNNTGSFGQNYRLTGTLTGSGSLLLDGSQGVEFRGDTSGYAGIATVTSGALTFNPSANTSFGGVIAGTRPVIKAGENTMTFGTAHTYTGTTTINQGTLSVTGSGVLGGASGSTTDANNIVFGTSGANMALEFETAVNLGPASQIRFRNTGGTIGNGGTLRYIGTGNETVSKTLQCDSSIGIRLESDSVGGSVTFNGPFSQSGRALFLGGTGTGNNTLATALTTGSSMTKRGTGTWVLSAANTYTGATAVESGTLLVNGSLGNTSGVSVASGGVLGGSGSMAATISGAGLVSPGNSPGITTATAVDPTGGLDFALEFTATGSPTYSNTSASVNDVLRLTGGTPFTASLTATNVVDLYFDVTTLTSGDIFQGGFYTDTPGDFLASISDGTFAYWVTGNGSGTDRTFNGQGYYSLANYDAGLSVTHSTVAQTAAFVGGTVNGQVTQFAVVPEPAALGWAAAAMGLACWRIARRRHR